MASCGMLSSRASGVMGDRLGSYSGATSTKSGSRHNVSRGRIVSARSVSAGTITQPEGFEVPSWFLSAPMPCLLIRCSNHEFSKRNLAGLRGFGFLRMIGGLAQANLVILEFGVFSRC